MAKHWIEATVFTDMGDLVTKGEFESHYEGSLTKLIDSAFALGCLVVLEQGDPIEEDPNA